MFSAINKRGIRRLSTEIIPPSGSMGTLPFGLFMSTATLVGGICWRGGSIETRVQTLQEGQNRMEKNIEKIDSKLDRILVGSYGNSSPRKGT